MCSRSIFFKVADRSLAHFALTSSFVEVTYLPLPSAEKSRVQNKLPVPSEENSLAR
jgi:hypothetical protein